VTAVDGRVEPKFSRSFGSLKSRTIDGHPAPSMIESERSAAPVVRPPSCKLITVLLTSFHRAPSSVGRDRSSSPLHAAFPPKDRGQLNRVCQSGRRQPRCPRFCVASFQVAVSSSEFLGFMWERTRVPGIPETPDTRRPPPTIRWRRPMTNEMHPLTTKNASAAAYRATCCRQEGRSGEREIMPSPSLQAGYRSRLRTSCAVGANADCRTPKVHEAAGARPQVNHAIMKVAHVDRGRLVEQAFGLCEATQQFRSLIVTKSRTFAKSLSP